MQRNTKDRGTRTLDDFFKEGISLFNTGKYFESHEAWEMCWKQAKKDKKEDRDFYHGLIFVAAGFVHYEKQNYYGVKTMFTRAKQKLAPFEPTYKEINVIHIVKMLDGYLSDIVPQSSSRTTPTIIKR